MKKLKLLAVFLLLNLDIHAQADLPPNVRQGIDDLVNECLSLLGKTVPNDFLRTSRNRFRSVDGNIYVVIENDLIYASSLGNIFDKTDEAAQFIGIFYTYFSNSDWTLYSSLRDGCDIYQRNSIFACIYPPQRRDDGYIVGLIAFSRKYNVLLY
jgi:hypothetical protein